MRLRQVDLLLGGVRPGAARTREPVFNPATGERIGTYPVATTADLDAALAWGTKAPTARYGSVEVRPVVDLSTLGAPAGA